MSKREQKFEDLLTRVAGELRGARTRLTRFARRMSDGVVNSEPQIEAVQDCREMLAAAAVGKVYSIVEAVAPQGLTAVKQAAVTQVLYGAMFPEHSTNPIDDFLAQEELAVWARLADWLGGGDG